jgi:hypothetical protein
MQANQFVPVPENFGLKLLFLKKGSGKKVLTFDKSLSLEKCFKNFGLWQTQTGNFLSLEERAGLPDFCWCMIPKPEKNVPNEHKMYQKVIKYPKCLRNFPNGHKT